MKQPNNNSVVLIRLDKIGDLVCTLACDELLKFVDPQPQKVSWVIAQGLGSIVNQSDIKRNFTELSLVDWWNSFLKLLNFLKQESPQTTVVFYAPWWVSLAVWLAKVPRRIGRRSQWHSFLFFNKTLRQSRSLGEKHEADYNKEILELAFPILKTKTSPILKLTAPSNTELLSKFELKEQEYFVVHPGMAGSALNWPQEKYNELIENLIKFAKVAITGTEADELFLSSIKARWKDHKSVVILQNKLKMPELLQVLKSAKAVIAPSTGVLHLAASLESKCVGIYSPIATHHPRRWGPRGIHANYLVPQVQCPAITKCLGQKCSAYPCMSSIKVQEVLTCLTLN